MNAGDITTAIKNSIRAISKGEFLLRLRADKLYLHILYLFVLAWLSIMLSLKVDKKLTKEGENKATIEELKIHYAETEAELIRVQSASSTQTRLSQMGSKLCPPSKPATKIGKK
ncbi:MAG: hypothetical protein II652_02290 [Bacteroidales bacterium]|jgi:hypothetical protein|nr:hypothetical protein [Bacteroidales bacterium]MBQ4299300.1 hypothetical protein [Bacteroidales bacterium]